MGIETEGSELRVGVVVEKWCVTGHGICLRLLAVASGARRTIIKAWGRASCTVHVSDAGFGRRLRGLHRRGAQALTQG